MASRKSLATAQRPGKERIAAGRRTPLPEPPPLPLTDAYLAYLSFERRLSAKTVTNIRRDLRDLARFAATPQKSASSLTSNDIRRFLATTHSRGMSPRAIARLLSGWRGYFRYALGKGEGVANPCDGVRAPKAARPLPRTLSPEEAIRLVSFEDDSVQGIRDRAVFELLYSCGLRIAECVGLNITSIDFATAEVRVTGKGNKTRIVPVGAPALAAVQKWMKVRAELAPAQPNVADAALFLGVRGKRISARVLELRIKQYARSQGIDADVHPHMLRHSFASHLLQSSQNLRAVQELMGHASIASTQVYTHLDFQHLASVYDKAHPRAKKK